GIGLRASFPISDRASLGLTYTLVLDDTEVADVLVDHDNDVLTPAIDQCDQEGTFLTSVVGYTLNWDRRNETVHATRGYDLQLSQDVAGLGGEVNYLR